MLKKMMYLALSFLLLFNAGCCPTTMMGAAAIAALFASGGSNP